MIGQAQINLLLRYYSDFMNLDLIGELICILKLIIDFINDKIAVYFRKGCFMKPFIITIL